MAATLGASSIKPGAIYLRLGFLLMARVFTYLRLQWQLNLFPFRYKARNFKITVSSALYSRAYKLFCDKSIAANLGASSIKPGAIYLRLGFSLMVRVFRSFSVARLPVAICSRWGHLEIDRNSVRTLVKSSRPIKTKEEKLEKNPSLRVEVDWKYNLLQTRSSLLKIAWLSSF